jgi:hypothetical protein
MATDYFNFFCRFNIPRFDKRSIRCGGALQNSVQLTLVRDGLI